MTLSDTLAIWGIVLSVAGLAATVVGFWLAIVQLRKTATSAEATKKAIESTSRRMLYNHLLVVLPQMRTLEADIDAALVVDDKVAAVRALVSFSHTASQVAALLDSEEERNAELIGQLRSTARAASLAKSELVSGSKRSLKLIVQDVLAEISDVSSQCAGLSTTYQGKVA